MDFLAAMLAESGLGGMLAILPSARGGCGNELILTTFLMVLPVLFTPDTALG